MLEQVDIVVALALLMLEEVNVSTAEPSSPHHYPEYAATHSKDRVRLQLWEEPL